MSHKWVLGTLAAFALVQVGFAAGPSHFRAAPVFDGKTLAGWHPVGQADWRVENGEIVGTPKTPAGGWLVLDKSYQDTGFFASFRCAAGCKTGVMLRAETPDLVDELAFEYGVRPAMLALGKVGIDRRHARVIELSIEVVPEGPHHAFAIQGGVARTSHELRLRKGSGRQSHPARDWWQDLRPGRAQSTSAE